MFYNPKESFSPMTFVQTMNAVNRQLFILGKVSDRKIGASHLRLSRIELFVVGNANR